MVQEKISVFKRGRPSKEDSSSLRGQAFKILWSKYEEPSESHLLTYKQVEQTLQVDRKTVRTVFREIADISTDITLVPEGILVGRETYYRKHLGIARDLKGAIADMFVDLLPGHVTVAASAGTTVACCVKRLVEKRRYHVIVTNNVGVIDQLGWADIGTVVLTGGEYKTGIHGCVGNQAVEAFDKAKCEAGLIGVSGVNEKGELFVRHCEEIPVMNQICRSVTHYVFIVVDVYKLTQVDTWRFTSISELLYDKERPERKIYVITNPYELIHNQKHLEQQAKNVYDYLKGIDGRVDVLLAKP